MRYAITDSWYYTKTPLHNPPSPIPTSSPITKRRRRADRIAAARAYQSLYAAIGPNPREAAIITKQYVAALSLEARLLRDAVTRQGPFGPRQVAKDSDRWDRYGHAIPVSDGPTSELDAAWADQTHWNPKLIPVPASFPFPIVPTKPAAYVLKASEIEAEAWLAEKAIRDGGRVNIRGKRLQAVWRRLAENDTRLIAATSGRRTGEYRAPVARDISEDGVNPSGRLVHVIA